MNPDLFTILCISRVLFITIKKNSDWKCWCKLHHVIIGYMNGSTCTIHVGNFSLSVRIMNPLEKLTIVCELIMTRVCLWYTLLSNIVFITSEQSLCVLDVIQLGFFFNQAFKRSNTEYSCCHAQQ